MNTITERNITKEEGSKMEEITKEPAARSRQNICLA